MPKSEQCQPQIESIKALESAERIKATKDILDKIVQLAQNKALPYDRNIEVLVDVINETWSREETDKNLRTLDLKTYPDEGNPNVAYHLSLNFSLDKDNQIDSSKPLMLSIESPVDIPVTDFDIAGALAAGNRNIKGLNIQDFLYSDGADSVPVRENDYSYVHSYRQMGNTISYKATKVQMDAILKILADAEYSGGKLTELVPEIKKLVEVV